MARKVLIVDDEPGIRQALGQLLEFEGYEVRSADNATDGITQYQSFRPHLVFMDVKMAGIDGLEALKRLRELDPTAVVVMISGHATIQTAVEATQRGAYDILEKPLDTDRILVTLRNALSHLDLHEENARLRERIESRFEIVGRSYAIRAVTDKIEKVAKTPARVLITGENGTGKELVARAIHKQSQRAERPFVEVNCAAIPSELIESELFGHMKGSFTGAVSDRAGKFEQADTGTLFLDEIGDMSLALQTRLLRVLAESEFFRVGGQSPIRVDVRVIAATHQDLGQGAATGRFREDLYHRLNVMRIEVPPLRQRREDIRELSRFYLEQAANELGVASKTLSADTVEALQRYDWPGNVRELVNVCRRLTVTAAGREIVAHDLPSELGGVASQSGADWTAGLSQWAEAQLAGVESPPLLSDALPAFERTLILTALRRARGKRLEAAKLLGWGRNTLTRKIKELGLEGRV